jgi:hypothetical protein
MKNSGVALQGRPKLSQAVRRYQHARGGLFWLRFVRINRWPYFCYGTRAYQLDRCWRAEYTTPYIW